MDRATRAEEVDRRLQAAFHSRLPRSDRGITWELIHAVLSQNTSRRNYNLAYERLRDSYPTVGELAGARASDIERCIRPGGLSRQKSSAIKKILWSVHEETGGFSLEFIRDMRVSDAREYLTSLPGVGPKTASVVLMFADRRKVLPVDTHVLRTSKRIGLVDDDTNAERAELELENIVPPGRRPRMHLNLVKLGREVCRARNPLHEICPVNMVCEYYRSG